MRCAVLGAGDDGLRCAIRLAALGHRVVVADRDAGRIGRLRGDAPDRTAFAAERMKAWKRYADNDLLLFTVNVSYAVRHAEAVVYALPLSNDASGSGEGAGLSSAEGQAGRILEELGPNLGKARIVAVHTAVRAGTCGRLAQSLQERYGPSVQLWMIPSLSDPLHPYDPSSRLTRRIVIGVPEAVRAEEQLSALFPLGRRRLRITDVRTAELLQIAFDRWIQARGEWAEAMSEQCRNEGVALSDLLGELRFVAERFRT
ncbi:hypothetical protein [Paenibacillus sp. MSJ-34]|uniref:hypothetical protein n=1 Tax=Paenibacillus sp. MSJ-34 TaxID=2841529 RepID=UPI001C111C17|nr:hypothetical protein [Paenibacillus sp. MSJ-34]